MTRRQSLRAAKAVGADQPAALMLAARILGQALMLAFALLYKHVRVLEVVRLIAIS